MADKALELQLKVRQNSEEMGEFLRDLDKWEENVKQKDEELKFSKVSYKTSLPPVRNQTKKRKSKKKKQQDSTVLKPKTRISSYDYRSWDKFDVDKVIEGLEEEEEMETLTSSEEEEDEEETAQLEEERRLQRALLEKDKGNDLFKVSHYEEAIHCYTTAMLLDPANAIMPANRAMALLRVTRYGAAEADCDLALSLDNTYTKAFLRRGKARFHLEKFTEALSDFEEALRLEPGNKQAEQEVNKIKQKLDTEEEAPTEPEDSSQNNNTKDSVQQRAKQPLKRVFIEEIGSESSDEEEQKHSVGSSTITDPPPEKSRGEPTAATLSEQTRDPAISTSSPGENTAILANINAEDLAADNNDVTFKSFNAAEGSSGVLTSAQKPFAVPKTSIQFQADWKKLRNKPNQLFKYLKKIRPESYPRLFQQSIDSDVLQRILSILQDYYIPGQVPVYKELKHLADVKRFSMAVMFLSDNDRKVLENLFSYTRQNSSAACSPCESELTALSKKYGL